MLTGVCQAKTTEPSQSNVILDQKWQSEKILWPCIDTVTKEGDREPREKRQWGRSMGGVKRKNEA